MSLEIDLDKILREKRPDLAKWLPRFAVNYIKRTIHQDEINYILRTFGHLEGAEFIRAALGHMQITATVTETAPLDPNGRYIFASNHPLGGLDGLILTEELEKRYGTTRVVVNDLLMHLSPISSLFVPINKYGKQSAEYATRLSEMYSSDAQILFFPAGLCSRKIHGKVQDPEWKKNFITKAIEYERDIVPVYTSGQNSAFFYNLSRFRKAIGIKANIELFYLPDEMFRKQGENFDIIIGKPIRYKEITKDKSMKEWAAEIRRHAYELKK